MHNALVFAVDHEAHLRSAVRLLLEKQFVVAEVWSGADCLDRLDLHRPNLIVLNAVMPGLDGWATLKRIRTRSDTPVVLMTPTGRDNEQHRASALGVAAAIFKSAAHRQLRGRVATMLSRLQHQDALSPWRWCGLLLIHPIPHIVLCRGRAVALSPREYGMLASQAAHAGRIVPWEQLFDGTWGCDFAGEPTVVDRTIVDLQRKLGDGGEIIEAVPGVGYRMLRRSRVSAAVS